VNEKNVVPAAVARMYNNVNDAQPDLAQVSTGQSMLPDINHGLRYAPEKT